MPVIVLIAYIAETVVAMSVQFLMRLLDFFMIWAPSVADGGKGPGC